MSLDDAWVNWFLGSLDPKVHDDLEMMVIRELAEELKAEFEPGSFELATDLKAANVAPGDFTDLADYAGLLRADAEMLEGVLANPEDARTLARRFRALADEYEAALSRSRGIIPT